MHSWPLDQGNATDRWHLSCTPGLGINSFVRCKCFAANKVAYTFVCSNISSLRCSYKNREMSEMWFCVYTLAVNREEYQHSLKYIVFFVLDLKVPGLEWHEGEEILKRIFIFMWRFQNDQFLKLPIIYQDNIILYIIDQNKCILPL